MHLCVHVCCWTFDVFLYRMHILVYACLLIVSTHGGGGVSHLSPATPNKMRNMIDEGQCVVKNGYVKKTASLEWFTLSVSPL